MAISEVSSSSSLSIRFQSHESHKTETHESSESDAPASQNVSAVSVNISASASQPATKPDIVSSHSEGLQRAQSRFERIDADHDGKASQEELIAIKKELNDKGRQTPGLDRVIQNFSKLDSNSDGGLQFNELRPESHHEKPAAPPEPAPQAVPAPQGPAPQGSVTPPASATESGGYSDPELNELLKSLSNSGIKGSLNFYKNNNGSSVSSSSSDESSKKSVSSSAAIDPNTAFASYSTSVLPGGSAPDALDRVVQSSSVIQSDPKGAVAQTLNYYGLKVNS